jgi:uncharacterized HAD superfamily protein
MINQDMLKNEQEKIVTDQKAKKIASDLDGVLAFLEPDRDKYMPDRLNSYFKKARYTGFLSSNSRITIITGRKEKYRFVTEKWLNQNSIKYSKLVMMPNNVIPSLESQIELKAFHIENLDIDLYYEDEKKIAKELVKRCPNCAIIVVSDFGDGRGFVE